MRPRWPDLSTIDVVRSRPATAEDLRLGRATFMIDPVEVSTGTPLDIALPQYALLHGEESDAAVPVVVIQAERDGETVAVGYRTVASGETGVAMLGEIELLGDSVPGSLD